MKLTTKGRYAVTAMMDLAIQSSASPVALEEISGRQDISQSYLEQLFALLRRAGLVEGIRGPRGGYQLARDVNEISIAEVIAAVDENIDLTCGKGSSCSSDADPCLTHGLWTTLSEQIYNFLHGIKLGELIKSPEVLKITQKREIGRVADIPVHLQVGNTN